MRPKKLAYEILGLLAVCLATGAVLFWFLAYAAEAVAVNFCWQRDILLTQDQQTELVLWVRSGSLVTAVLFFLALFLVLLGQRLSYIRHIIQAVDGLGQNRQALDIPLEGNNELTQLARSIHSLWRRERALREKELALARERELLIRTLSHDIRTPLTSILSYSELLQSRGDWKQEELEGHLALIHRKAVQIRELTDVLLSGSGKDREHFRDARLLMVQLAEEFSEALEDRFQVQMDLDGCPAFSASLDVQELRRVFDNLSSNVSKYADPNQPVRLSVGLESGELAIRQENGVRQASGGKQGFQMGLNSIRRIAQGYGGRVEQSNGEKSFRIAVFLSDI